MALACAVDGNSGRELGALVGGDGEAYGASDHLMVGGGAAATDETPTNNIKTSRT